jgi:hypothetical protein
VPAADWSVAYGPIRKIGLYSVSWTGVPGSTDQEIDGRVRRVVAANLMFCGSRKTTPIVS